MLNIDEIAGEAVDEVFGFRGRARPVVRAVRQVRRTRAAVRDHNRAGWGSPGWQAAQGAYDPYSAAAPSSYSDDSDDSYDSFDYEDSGDGFEDDGDEEYGMLESEIDQVLDEDDEEPGEEFGRRPRRPARRAVRRMVRRVRNRRQNRRQNRRGSSSSSSSSSYPTPMLAQPGEVGPITQMYSSPSSSYEEDEEDERDFVTPQGFAQTINPTYGFLPEPSRDSLFTDSVKMGLGMGLGFTVVALGAGLVSRALR